MLLEDCLELVEKIQVAGLMVTSIPLVVFAVFAVFDQNLVDGHSILLILLLTPNHYAGSCL